MYTVISLAVAAASPGDTIKVCPGNYTDNVIVSKTLMILGAQAGRSPFAGRTFGAPDESTVKGTPALPVFTILATDVRIDGFSMTDPQQETGILIKMPGDGAFIANNIIDTIGGVNLTDHAQAVYLENGPDNVKVVSNLMRNINSTMTSNGGVFIGDSTATNPSVNTLISGNLIENVTTPTKGAYGIHINNGNGATANTGLQILNNVIRKLNGAGWVHAVGLEANTPGVVVRTNCISQMNSPSPNRVAVWFEADPSYATGHVNYNNFDVTPMSDYGIAVAVAGTASVDGTNNWWNSSDGPGPVGPGHGALVSAEVNYRPWLHQRAGGACQLGGQGCRGTDGDGDVEGKHGGKAHFHMHHSDCDDQAEQEDFSDEGSGTDFHSTQVNSVVYDDVAHTVTIAGLGTNNGLPVVFTIVAADSALAPPGLFGITLSDGYTHVGDLLDGSITLQ